MKRRSSLRYPGVGPLEFRVSCLFNDLGGLMAWSDAASETGARRQNCDRWHPFNCALEQVGAPRHLCYYVSSHGSSVARSSIAGLERIPGLSPETELSLRATCDAICRIGYSQCPTTSGQTMTKACGDSSIVGDRLPWVANSEAIWGSLPQLFASRAYTINGPAHAFATRKEGDPSSRAILPETLEFLGLQTQDDFDADYRAIVGVRDSLGVGEVSGGILLENLRLIGGGMSLEEGALHLLLLRIVERLSGAFSQTLRPYLGGIDPIFMLNLDAILGLGSGECERLLAKDGALARSGLLVHQRGVSSPLEDRLRLPQGLMSSLLKPLASRAEAIRRLIPLAPPGTLGMQDYPHHSQESSIVISHLGGALESGRPGVNVLLYGEPGVGKTELVSAVARELGAALFSIGGSDPDTDRPLTPAMRLHRFRFAQGLVRSAGRSLILVDEAEDLFPKWWKDKKEDVPSKALLNETLETNLVPTFWLTNQETAIEEAFMRRFDIVLRITAPNRKRKAALLLEHAPAVAGDAQWTSRAVAHAKMSPAVIARMGSVVTGLHKAGPAGAREALDTLRLQYLRAIDEDNHGASRVGDDTTVYGMEWLNPSTPLEPILHRLRIQPRGRLLFHGPPGTGKTAFAHHLARELGCGILAKRSSDLMSMWVGRTERNLREMFDEARGEGDLLVLDEADSFLAARNAGQPHWQTTHTNELLTQMEAFDGLFVCTTNLLTHLDAAAMRRFDLKIGFNSLLPQQRLAMFRDACRRQRLDRADGAAATLVRRQSELGELTPGDVATALRKISLAQLEPDAFDLLDALVDECRYKPGIRARIGFV